MPSPPRRARFQIHLSTAVVLMFAAGGLIWANVTPRAKERHLRPDGITAYGWPIEFYWRGEDRDSRHFDGFVCSLLGLEIPYDVVVWLGVLFAVWYICERLIRRRAARKGD